MRADTKIAGRLPGGERLDSTDFTAAADLATIARSYRRPRIRDPWQGAPG
ncbi:hypothetical protein [Mycobacterium europaeum]|nr:hypothetical protein [Mycobacterium europaeum]